jgi:hypothetical protein
MADFLANGPDSAASSADLQSGMQSEAPTETPRPDSHRAAALALGLKAAECDAPKHATNTSICAKGHQWPGAPSIARKNEAPSLPPDLPPLEEDEAYGLSSVQVARRQLVRLQRRAAESEARLAGALTPSKRFAESKALNDVEGAIRETTRFLEARERESGAATKSDEFRERKLILRSLPDAVIAVLEQWTEQHPGTSPPPKLTDAEFMASWRARGGPAMLEIQLTDGALPPRHVAVPDASLDAASVPTVSRPDEITERWLRPQDKPAAAPDYGIRPLLVVGARTAKAVPSVPHQITSEGHRHDLRPNDPGSLIPELPVYGWTGDEPGFDYVSRPTAGPALA